MNWTDVIKVILAVLLFVCLLDALAITNYTPIPALVTHYAPVQLMPSEFSDSSGCGIFTNKKGIDSFRLQACTMTVMTTEFVGEVSGIDIESFSDENVNRDPSDKIVIIFNEDEVMEIHNDAGERAPHPTIAGMEMYTNTSNVITTQMFETPYIGTEESPIHIKMILTSSKTDASLHGGISRFTLFAKN